ncbi:MAG: DUF3052 family protein [Alphaproteobacteria bacterium]|nr:DUF3052 family protein [Alphaproteobacteria bacterium]
MAGYAGTPLVRKLGIAAGASVCAIDAPATYRDLLEPLPPDVRWPDVADAAVDLVHVFVTRRDALAAHLVTLRAALRPDAVVWVSWPKKASKVPTDVTEDVVRAEALPLGFVDVKVCAVDAVWSGLKLVVRKALR